MKADHAFDPAAPYPFARVEGGIAVHRLDLDAGPAGPDAGLLSPDEAARAARFHFARHRDRFIRGRAFLRRVLAAELAVAPQALRFGSEGNGKPVIEGAGLWFNLSHSGPFAVLAVSRTGPVGIDIERLDRKVDAAALGAHCFLPHENAALAEVTGRALSERFFAYWTAKEARMKLTGEGMSLSPREIALELCEGRPVGYLAPASPLASLLPVKDTFPATVCTIAFCSNALRTSCPTGPGC